MSLSILLELLLTIWKGVYNRPGAGSRTAATSKMELLVITVIGFQPLTIITKYSILDVAAILDPPLRRHQIIWKHCGKNDVIKELFVLQATQTKILCIIVTKTIST